MLQKFDRYIIKTPLLKEPVRVDDIFQFSIQYPALDYIPIQTSTGVKGIFFKDIIPIVLNCSAGNGCSHLVTLYRDMPQIDIAGDEFIETFKKAVELEAPVFVMVNDLFRGVIPYRNVVSIIMEHQIKEAIMTNPLTGLPGNYSIRLEFDKKVKCSLPFWICYTDLNDFKAYNDKYGIAAGDNVIRFCANLLKDNLQEHFLGHVGGDDFVFFLPVNEVAILDSIVLNFDNDILSFYSDTDRAQGFIVSRDRTGRVLRFPIMSLAIAVCPVTRQVKYDEVTERLSEVKKEAKQVSKTNRRSTYVISKDC
jgi:GGDEF domain-containing protein